MSTNWKNEKITEAQSKHLKSLGYNHIEGMNKLEYDIVMKEHYTKVETTEKQVETVAKIIEGKKATTEETDIKEYLKKWGTNHYTLSVIISKYGFNTTKDRINAILGNK